MEHNDRRNLENTSRAQRKVPGVAADANALGTGAALAELDQFALLVWRRQSSAIKGSIAEPGSIAKSKPTKPYCSTTMPKKTRVADHRVVALLQPPRMAS